MVKAYRIGLLVSNVSRKLFDLCFLLFTILDRSHEEMLTKRRNYVQPQHQPRWPRLSSSWVSPQHSKGCGPPACSSSCCACGCARASSPPLALFYRSQTSFALLFQGTQRHAMQANEFRSTIVQLLGAFGICFLLLLQSASPHLEFNVVIGIPERRRRQT